MHRADTHLMALAALHDSQLATFDIRVVTSAATAGRSAVCQIG